MNRVFVLLWMIFFHIVDDYYLQGWLSSAKQKEWWKQNAPQELYKNDYLMALFIHGFSWAFMIMFPIAFYMGFDINLTFIVIFIWNTMTHCYIDNSKANWKIINLVEDQSLHIIQIIMTFACLILF